MAFGDVVAYADKMLYLIICADRDVMAFGDVVAYADEMR